MSTKLLTLLACIILFSTHVFSQSLSCATATKSSYVGNYNVTCNGATNGSVDFTPSGGTPPYTYLWSNSATTKDLSGLSAGTYTITVNDNASHSCTRTASMLQPSTLGVILTPHHITCHDLTNGYITTSVSGGTPAYTYLWSNSATTSSITGLSSGSKSVTITDANGCTTSASTSISNPSAISTDLTTDTNVYGFNVTPGKNDGAINLTVSGGTGAYTYQ